MALVRSHLGKRALYFSNNTCSSSLLDVDGCQTKLKSFKLKSLWRGRWAGSNAAVFSSQEVTAAAQPTPERLPTSAGLRCWTKSKLSRMSRVEKMTGGTRGLLGDAWGRVSPVRAYSAGEPLYKTKTGYYDALELSPGATHAQIKTAYYKLSFLYHPDKNAGREEATLRFSDISEAYNVLGNKALKKKYDRGILSPSDLVGSPRAASAEETSGAAKQPPGRASRSVMGVDSQAVFDFDHFIKSHYGEQLQKQRDMQVRKEEIMRKKDAEMHEWKFDNFMEIAIAGLFAMAVVILLI